jgi:4-amino-4-deoxy-L-arabinose transferase-like glycosyltransferase
MSFRKLRIAWSVGWGLVVVLLTVLWVRSYWWYEYAFKPIDFRRAISFSSQQGQTSIRVATFRLDSYFRQNDGTMKQIHPSEWQFGSGPSLAGVGNRGFSFRLHPHLSIKAPHWFCVLISIALAIPGVPAVVGALASFRRSRWRFSLRTLLIATTLLAVVLGLAVWAGS